MIRDQINSYARKFPKWVAYLLGLVPFGFLIFAVFTNSLGPDPVKYVEHELGEIGLQFLVAGLAVTPLLKYARINLVKFRRVLGVLAFFYIAMHFVTWMVLDMSLIWSEIAKDLVKRWYIVIGMASLVLMIPLAVTSNDWAVRKLGGANWRWLHKVTYAVVLLGGIHNVMAQKVWEAEPLIYLTAIFVLLALRMKPQAMRRTSQA